MTLKNITIVLNFLLILLFFGYFISHSFPESLNFMGFGNTLVISTFSKPLIH